jgi:hypothetical protein
MTELSILLPPLDRWRGRELFEIVTRIAGEVQALGDREAAPALLRSEGMRSRLPKTSLQGLHVTFGARGQALFGRLRISP